MDEIIELKKNILSKAKEKQNYWFDVEEFIRQKYPDQLHYLEKGPYGVSPPFMLVSSTTQIQTDTDLQVGREFKWGTCYI